MEQLSNRERMLTTRDLRVFHNTVVQGLLSGQGFTVLYGGRPLARLLPIEPLLELPAPKQLQEHGFRLDRLEVLLGQRDLARMLGLTLTTYLIYRASAQFSESTLNRLVALAEVVDDLEATLSVSRIRAWFQRASRELKGVSVLSALAFPWNPGDATITQVERLARRERVGRLASTPSPSSRRP